MFGECGEKEGAGFVQPSEDRERKDLSYCLQLPGGHGEDGVTLFSEMPNKRTRINGHKSLVREILTL